MLKANVGSSNQSNGFTAGEEAAKKAVIGLDKISIALLYASADYDQKDLLRGVQSVLGNTPIIGSTSFNGVLTPDGLIGGSDGFCSLMVIEDEDLKISVSGFEKDGDARSTGQRVAKDAMAKLNETSAPDYFYMVAYGGEEESYLRGIQDVIGRVPFFGGGSADNTMEGFNKEYCNNLVIGNGVVVAFFYTQKKFGQKFGGYYHATGKSGIITKVENKRILKEIDGRPALEVYADWCGTDIDQVSGGNLLVKAITNPIGIKDIEENMTWIYHPVFGDEDQGMTVLNDLVKDTCISFMGATVDELIASVSTVIEDALKNLGGEPGALVLIHCGGRSAAIGDRLGEVISEIKKVLGDIPFISPLTFGEYGYEKWSKNGCGGLMLSAFILEK